MSFQDSAQRLELVAHHEREGKLLLVAGVKAKHGLAAQTLAAVVKGLPADAEATQLLAACQRIGENIDVLEAQMGVVERGARTLAEAIRSGGVGNGGGGS